jgi:1,4-alpha-glucan branching enzyme
MLNRMFAAVAAMIVTLWVTSCPTNAQDVGDKKVSVTFQYSAPSAKAVYLAGQFNGWLENDNGKIKEKPEWLLKKDDNGNWKITIQLAPGNYPYKFVVDGEWKVDPANSNTIDDGFGGQNSVKIVSRE